MLVVLHLVGATVDISILNLVERRHRGKATGSIGQELASAKSSAPRDRELCSNQTRKPS
jgi:hypothetical protein